MDIQVILVLLLFAGAAFTWAGNYLANHQGRAAKVAATIAHRLKRVRKKQSGKPNRQKKSSSFEKNF